MTHASHTGKGVWADSPDALASRNGGNVGDKLLTEQQQDEGSGSDHSDVLARKPQDNPSNDDPDEILQRSLSISKEDEEPLMCRSSPSQSSLPTSKEEPVSWTSLPRKSQLAILTFARFSEPLAQTSLMAYLFYQLRWFDPSLPDSTISWQAGIVQASFSAAQFFTAALWGKAADHIGRKPVVLIGLGGLCMSCFAYAFTTSFALAVVVRSMGGALNGNVGIMRTMISEIVPEKKYQSRAFLLLPTFLNIGGILGPILGGFLGDPVKNLSHIFGPKSLLGGSEGVSWMKSWPYALPNLVTGTILFIAIASVFLGLDETHEHRRYQPDRGRQITRYLQNVLALRRLTPKYVLINQESTASSSAELENHQSVDATGTSSAEKPSSHSSTSKVPFRRIWTRNVILSLASHFFLILNIATFNALLFTFLPTPRSSQSTNSTTEPSSHLSGGLGLSESKVGLTTALIGLLGFPLQLLLYPALQSRFGTLRCYRIFLPFSAMAAFLTPLLVLLPNHAWVVWPSLIIVLALEVLARTLALPGSIILINESVPMVQVKGLVHGVGQSVASAGKTVGPALGGWGLGLGLQHRAVGAVWWTLGGVTLLGWLCALAAREKKEDDRNGGDSVA
ncbi:MAG: hypothetical protein M1820_009676 [Bogoriella megaspora]|nr:MAG: hypothetical protein M1820_009676 [Bogoriella megaspora]